MSGMIIGFLLPSVQASRKMRLPEPCSKRGNIPFKVPCRDRIIFFPFTDSFQHACRASDCPLHAHGHQAVKHRGSNRECCLFKDSFRSSEGRVLLRSVAHSLVTDYQFFPN